MKFYSKSTTTRIKDKVNQTQGKRKHQFNYDIERELNKQHQQERHFPPRTGIFFIHWDLFLSLTLQHQFARTTSKLIEHFN